MSQSPVDGAVGHLHLVVAFDQVGGIGKDGKIPWFLPPDLKRFKELTSSLPEGGNPGSFNIVIMVILKSSINALLSNFCNCSCRAGRRGIHCRPSQSLWLDASTSSYPPTLTLFFPLALCLPLILNQLSRLPVKFPFTVKSSSSAAKVFTLRPSRQERLATSPRLVSTCFRVQTCAFCYFAGLDFLPCF